MAIAAMLSLNSGIVAFAAEGDGEGNTSGEESKSTESEASSSVGTAQDSTGESSSESQAGTGAIGATEAAGSAVDSGAQSAEEVGLTTPGESNAVTDATEDVKSDLADVMDKLDGTENTEGIDDKLDNIAADIETVEKQEEIVNDADIKQNIDEAVVSTEANAETAANAANAAANATTTEEASAAVDVANQAAAEAANTVNSVQADLQAAQEANQKAIDAYNDAIAQLEAAKNLSEEAKEAANQAVADAEKLVTATKAEMDAQYNAYVEVINKADSIEGDYKKTLESAIAIYKSQIPSYSEDSNAYWKQTRTLCEYLIKLNLAEQGIKVTQVGDTNANTGNWHKEQDATQNYVAVTYVDANGISTTKYYNYHQLEVNGVKTDDIVIVEKSYQPTSWAEEYTTETEQGSVAFDENDDKFIAKVNVGEHSFDVVSKGSILDEAAKEGLEAGLYVPGEIAGTVVDTNGQIYYVEITNETVQKPVDLTAKPSTTESAEENYIIDEETGVKIYASSKTDLVLEDGTLQGNADVKDAIVIWEKDKKHKEAQEKAKKNAEELKAYYETLGYHVTIDDTVQSYHTGVKGSGHTHYYYNFTITKDTTVPVTNYYTTNITTYAQAVTESKWIEEAITDSNYNSSKNENINAAVAAYQNALNAAKTAVDEAAKAVAQAKADLEKIQLSGVAADLEIGRQNLAAVEAAYAQAVANRDNAQASADAALASYNTLVAANQENQGGTDGGTGGGTTTTTTTPAAVPVVTQAIAPAEAPVVIPDAPVALEATPEAVQETTPATGNRTRGNAAVDNTEAVEELTVIDEEPVAQAAAIEEDTSAEEETLTTIEEEDTALASAMETKSFGWWWLLIVAAIGGGSYAGYRQYKKTKEAEEEI